MPRLDEAFTHLPSIGRVGLLEFVRAPSLEAGLAAASITERAAREMGGRFEWAGHVDQLLIGDVTPVPDEIFVSTYPSKKQALDVLAARREWGLDDVIEGSEVLAYRAPGVLRRAIPKMLLPVLGVTGPRTPVPDLAAAGGFDSNSLATGDPSLRPSAEAIAACAGSGIEGKVVMLNLLRYRRDAQGSGATGRAAYGRYGRRTVPLIGGLGGRIRAMGDAPLADGDTRSRAYDDFVCVQYPSRAHFIGMVTAPRYAAGHDDRDAGLDHTALLVCTSHAAFF